MDELTVNVKFAESFPGFMEYLYGDLVVCPAHIFEGVHGTIRLFFFGMVSYTIPYKERYNILGTI